MERNKGSIYKAVKKEATYIYFIYKRARMYQGYT